MTMYILLPPKYRSSGPPIKKQNNGQPDCKNYDNNDSNQ